MESFAKLDADEVMKDYNDDSVLIGPMGMFKGTTEIRKVIGGMVEEFSKPGMSMEPVGDPSFAGEIVYVQWKGETADNVYEYVTDTFVIKGDKIAVQTFGGKITPKS
jgi:ketosteroid isomerase-like protein